MSKGQRIHRFETAKLLSGVIYNEDRVTYLVRRGRFQDHPAITALLRSEPYLVEEGLQVRGLSASDPRRRNFVATDWRGHWVIGANTSSLTLADLCEGELDFLSSERLVLFPGTQPIAMTCP